MSSCFYVTEDNSDNKSRISASAKAKTQPVEDLEKDNATKQENINNKQNDLNAKQGRIEELESDNNAKQQDINNKQNNIVVNLIW